MSQDRTHSLLGVICLIVLTIFLSVACQKKGDPASPSGNEATTPPSAPVPQAGGGGGGIDGSGGDFQRSTLEEAKKAVAEEIKALPGRLATLKNFVTNSEEFVYEYKFGKNTYRPVLSFLQMHVLKNRDDSPKSPLEEGVRMGRIQIKPQIEPCDAKDGKHSGSAKGDLQSGEICLSYKSLQLIPRKVLNEQIFGLLIHELSHLSGFDESRAVEFQSMILSNRDMYSNSSASGFLNNLRACETEEIQNEIKEINASPYWQAQKKILVEMLSGQKMYCSTPNYMRDRISIFADDAERVSITRKFKRADFHWILTKEAKGVDGTFFGINIIQDLTTVASIRVETSTATLGDLDALVGTDAQCSPKILLANVIANIPSIVDVDCDGRPSDVETPDQVKARALKEKEILEGEKK